MRSLCSLTRLVSRYIVLLLEGRRSEDDIIHVYGKAHSAAFSFSLDGAA